MKKGLFCNLNVAKQSFLSIFGGFDMLTHVFGEEQKIEYSSSGKFLSREGGAVHPKRVLDTYVLLFGSSGEYKIAEEDEEFSLTPGTWLLLSPGRLHYGTTPCEPGLSHYWCHFRARQTGIPNEREFARLPAYGITNAPERIRLLFHRLIDSSRRDSPYRKRICDTTLSLILLELSESCLEAHTPTFANADKVLAWIRLYATEIRSVSEVAEHFGYNSEYLTTAMRRATGKSIVEHIREARITEAKNLLLCSDLSIKEIAFRCGFSDEKYFLRVFRHLTDLSPREYRNAYTKVHYNKR